MRKRWACWAGGLGLAVVYAGVAAWFTWPLASHVSDSLAALGDPLDSVWRVGWGQEALLTSPLHLFDSPVDYPHPRSYLLDELILGVAILALPLRLFTKNPVAIYNIALLATLALNALSAYLLARRLGCRASGAFVAGLIYAFAPIRMAHILHIGLLSAQYFPLAILLLDRLFEGAGWWTALALAVILTMQALSSQYFAFYMVLVVLLFVAMRFLERGFKRGLQPAGAWVKVLAAGALALLPVLPIGIAYRDMQHRYRVSRSLGENVRYSATLASFLTPRANQTVVWQSDGVRWRAERMILDDTDENPVETTFVGFLATLLGVLGGIVGWRRPLVRYVAVLGAVAAVLSLGPVLWLSDAADTPLLSYMPYRFLYEHVSGFDSMRAPARIGVLYCLSVACLAGFALSWLSDRLGRLGAGGRHPRRLGVVLSVAVVFGVCAESTMRPLTLSAIEVGERVPEVYRWLKRQPGGIVAELPFGAGGLAAYRVDPSLRYQYFSLFHGKRLVNGASNIRPRTTGLLALALARGSTGYGLAALEALGVTHVVAHNAPLPAEIAPAVADRLQGRQVAAFDSDIVYGIGEGDRFDRLSEAIPKGSTLVLGCDDREPLAVYLAALAWRLRDRSVYTRLSASFGQGYAGRPENGARYDYGLVPRGANSSACPGVTIWQDEFATACRLEGSAMGSGQ